ncbi:DUF1080 domain-containing protein [Cohnella pontilimi]|uniref:DUF1080 domain-containing protein n=1 Tax=Cohnella pontilimi TaxID=2564100 RepID=A0A4U0F8K2_9BACL|nr:family 43 glycosylhydrolase [Cohnella pontilimi]TJY41007.1 DUF1080 domain-containing protein [Cohnella pontilimi]
MIRKGWMCLAVLLVAAAGCTESAEHKPPEPPKRTYSNPISLPDEWGEYGLGDPFIFKFNGYYYLYVSTRDTDAGVKVWKSSDLTDWKYEGMCTEDPITKAAYAPEVRYWNGKFYMYTSPAGQGHYVLESVSPTGPFRVVTDNFGRTIDGTTFVDDDGQWYFYYAGPQGIQAAKMDDPVTVTGEGVPTGAYMGGWTEGPTVFKRNGKYYMTYTGNHVFSTGYRVDAAVSDSPLQGFKGMEDNPVLIRSEGDTVGLGHNSVVTGPDLDTQYIVYHNLEGPGVVGPLRHMNLDRIAWIGDRLTVWGPTSFPQPAPALPSFYDHFERDDIGKAWKPAGEGSWSVSTKQGLLADSAGKGLSFLLSDQKTEDDFTAEFHWQIVDGNAKSGAGAVFSYKDEKNYGTVLFDPNSREMTAEIRRNGVVAASGKARMPDGYDFGQLHLLRVEKSGASIRLYADEMNKLNLDLKEPIGGGRVGYVADNAQARFGFTAFSGFVGGSSSESAYHPLPGLIEMKPGTEMKKGDSVRYLVNVAKDGDYSLHFRIVPGPKGVKFRITDAGKPLASFEKPAGKAGQWEYASISDVKLKAGFQAWTLEIEDGSMQTASLEMHDYKGVTTQEDDFEDKNSFGWTRYEGMWSVKQGQLRAASLQPAKILFGEFGWTDYTFEADLTAPEENGQTGMLVRVTEPSNGFELNQNRADFLRGYYIYLDSEGVHLAKHNYDTNLLADAAYESPAPGEIVHLKVRVSGNRLQVFAGNSAAPILDYTDLSDQPFLHGKVGFRSVDSASRYDNVKVYP